MNTITIPKKIAGKDDLVILPKREYMALLEFKKVLEFSPTTAQKKALARAEANFRIGKTISYNELTSKLGLSG